MLETQPGQGELAAHGEQDRVPLDRRAVVEVDDMRVVGPLAGPCVDRPHAGPHVDAVPLQPEPDRLGAARMLGGGEPPDWTIVVGTPNRA